MSLRARVVTLIGIMFLISALVGTVLAGYEARRNLREELDSGLAGGRRTVESALEDLPRSDHPARDLRQLVATFDGNRHVQATLLGPDRRAAAASRPAAAADRTAPAWFGRLLGPRFLRAWTAHVELEAPGAAGGAREVVLTPVAGPDIDAIWRGLGGVVLLLLGSAAIGLVFVYLFIGAALRPLQALALEFVHIGAGDYRGRVATRGPSELLSLQRGFNSMVEQLAGMTERNRLLSDQLLTLQDEERADIARDLHDEIGPHLFAVNLDAQMIVQMSGRRSDEEILAQARSIQAAVGHIQRHVRDLLARLRPTQVTELGFRAALEGLVQFWSTRRPEISFRLAVEEETLGLDPTTKEVAYRVVQESLNNAVRHGRPTAIRVEIERRTPGEITVSIVDDGSPAAPALAPAGFGLIGMRERVAAHGGRLAFGARKDARGWRVAARLPVKAPATLQVEAAE